MFLQRFNLLCIALVLHFYEILYSGRIQRSYRLCVKVQIYVVDISPPFFTIIVWVSH